MSYMHVANGIVFLAMPVMSEATCASVRRDFVGVQEKSFFLEMTSMNASILRALLVRLLNLFMRQTAEALTLYRKVVPQCSEIPLFSAMALHDRGHLFMLQSLEAFGGDPRYRRLRVFELVCSRQVHWHFELGHHDGEMI